MAKRGLQVYFNVTPKHRNQYARTPKDLLDELEEVYGKFDFDPCPTNPDFDGLAVPWGQNNYVNPPFKDLKTWLTKAVQEWNHGQKQVVFLMPIRVHTAYFIDLVLPLVQQGKVQCFVIRGGVRFEGYKQRIPHGMMYVVFPFSNESEPNGREGSQQ